MDKSKFKKFVFYALLAGKKPDEIANYLNSKKQAYAQPLLDQNNNQSNLQTVLPTTLGGQQMNRGQVQSMASSQNVPYMDIIKKYFPQNQWNNASRVMQGESGGNPSAIGDNYPINGQTIPSYGLFQIRGLPGRPSPDQLMNPDINVKYAADLWRRQSWQPWTVARNLGIQ